MSIDNTRIDNAHIDGRPRTGLSTLDVLESEAIHIIREVAAEFDNPVLLFSGGKDSVTVLHLAAKAFWPAKIPFGLLHVDTGHNFPEILAFRDRTAERFGLDLTVAKVQDYIDDGRLRERPDGTRNTLQTQPLIDAIAAGGFDAVFGGARRDEDKARAKERIISLRDEFGGWNPSSQRPDREVFGDVDRARHLVERSAHTRDHRVASGESQPGVGGVDVPMAGDVRRICHGAAPSGPPRFAGEASIVEIANASVV